MDTVGSDPPDPFQAYISEPSPQTFAQVVQAYQFVVLEIAYQTTGDLASAEDVAQEVFWRLIRRPPRRSTIRSPRAYISRMAYTQALSWIRSEKRRRAREEKAAKPECVTGDDTRKLEELREVTRTLPPRLRVPLYLHFFLDLTLDDVSYVLGCSRRTVSRHINEAKKLLVKRLGPGALALLAAWPSTSQAHVLSKVELGPRLLTLWGSARPKGFVSHGSSLLLLLLPLVFLGALGVSHLLVTIPHDVVTDQGIESSGVTSDLDPLAPPPELGDEPTMSITSRQPTTRSQPSRIRQARYDLGVRGFQRRRAGTKLRFSGLSTEDTAELPFRLRTVEDLEGQALVITAESPTDGFGGTVRSLGDINGDGFQDLLLGTVQGASEEQWIWYILLGSRELPATLELSNWPSWGIRIRGGRDGLCLYPSCGIGDLDGDSYDDIAFRSPKSESTSEPAYACVLFGDAHLPHEIQADRLSEPPLRTCRIDPDRRVNRTGTHHLFDSGDVNGDGLLDLIVGSYLSYRKGCPAEEGLVYVVLGARPFPSYIDLSSIGSEYSGCRIALARQTGQDIRPVWFGAGVSSGHDLNGDGFDELCIAAPGPMSGDRKPEHDAHEAFVLFGRTEWPRELVVSQSTTQGVCRLIAEPCVKLRLGVPGFSSVDDVTLDGVPDLLLPKQGGRQGLYLFSGRSLLPGDWRIEEVKETFFVTRSNSQLWGTCLGDRDGDGRNDLALGSPLEDLRLPDRRKPGAVYLVSSRRDYPDRCFVDDSSLASSVIVGDAYLGRLGWTTVGADLDGDGLSECILAAPGSLRWGMPQSDPTGHFYILPGGMDLVGPLGAESFTPHVSDLSGGGTVLVRGYGFDGETRVLIGDMPLHVEGWPNLTRSWFRLVAAGDVNGDGYADFGIVVHIQHGGEKKPRGCLILVLGARRFPQRLIAITLPKVVGKVLHWPVTFYDATGVGDFNGDGFDDLYLGATLLFGRSTFPEKTSLHAELANGTARPLLKAPPAYRTDNPFLKPSAWKACVNGVGDQNGDGRDDLAVLCMEWWEKPREGKSRLNIVYGYAPEEVGASRNIAEPEDFDLAFDAVPGYNANLHYVAGGRDYNGDGVPDILIGDTHRDWAPPPSQGFVLFGGGLAEKAKPLDEVTECLELVNYRSSSEHKDSNVFPARLEFAGDVNGDGHEDLLTSDHGGIYIHFNPRGRTFPGGDPNAPWLCRDVNADGATDMNDAIAVLELVLARGTTTVSLRAADFDDNGVVNPKDVLELLAGLLGGRKGGHDTVRQLLR